MYHKSLSDRARYLKEDKEGVSKMSESMSTLVAEIMDEEKKEIAVKMLQDGKLTIEEVAKYFGIEIEQMQEVAEQMKTD